MKPDERKKKRWLMLEKFYELANGSANRYIISLWDVGAQLGWDRETTEVVYDYLEGEGLLAAMSLGGGATITHSGVKEVEAAQESPGEPTLHFPAFIVNVTGGDNINISGNVVGSAIGREAKAKARDNSVRQGDVHQPELDDELSKALIKAREVLEHTNLAQEDKGDVVDDFEKLTHELGNADANPARVQRLWGRIKEIAPAVAAVIESTKAVAPLLQR